MGKEGELWDDSALVQAFDDAMSKYKKMHSKNRNDVASVQEQTAALHLEDHAAIRDGGDDYFVSKTETGMIEGKNLAPVEENPCIGSTPEPYVDLSKGVVMQEAINGYTYSQGTEDYNQLLGQYYELEEKRQQILQRLNQFGNWNYQCSGENFSTGAQWGTSTSQEYQLPPSQTSHPAVACSCCPYVSQCCLAPCTTCSACSLGGACNGKTCTDTNAVTGSGKLPSVVDSDIVNTAMGAVERAISSMKTNEEIEKKKGNEGDIAQTNDSETDLTVVLNAWYSAGFYTGKYLTEQSFAKNQHK
ncbi:uncharacterized protein LOC116108636 [Pistacia vera]|uniref:uncharacterized protein LOC116108636 n=1 Tax=Pistacia vera TaxID=55513 RepID=UPI001263A44D|nr:uncharacterized protein LOC116108636 [Pistacia vera]